MHFTCTKKSIGSCAHNKIANWVIQFKIMRIMVFFNQNKNNQKQLLNSIIMQLNKYDKKYQLKALSFKSGRL